MLPVSLRSDGCGPRRAPDLHLHREPGISRSEQQLDGAIGLLPRPEAINIAGLDLDRSVLAELTTVPSAALRRELAEIHAYLQGFGAHAPAALFAELDGIERRLDP
jgi:GTP-dependent phosphoenolpyruvate carboxykinase